jgi:hypothetical protein
MKCAAGEHRLITLVARLNCNNDAFMDLFVVPPMRTLKTVRLLMDDPRLNTAIRLHDLADFSAAVTTLSTRRQFSIIWELSEKSVAIATKHQLKQLANVSQNELIRRGMNQKTLRRIHARTPVRPSKLAKCLKLLDSLRSNGDSRR